MVTIDGLGAEEQTLTANTTVLDNLYAPERGSAGVHLYAWKRGGEAIDGAINETYTLTQADVGAVITVTVGYTDSQGNDARVTSAATGAINAVETVDVSAPGEINNLEELLTFEQTISAALGNRPWDVVRINGNLDLDGQVGVSNYGSLSDYAFLSKVVEITGRFWLHEWNPPIGTTNLNVFSNLQSVNSIKINGKIAKKSLKNGNSNKNKSSEITAMQKYILSITKNGYGKRTSFYEYRVTNRGGKGIIGIKNSSRNGDVAASFPVDEGDQILISTDKGRIIRCAVKEIRTAGRNTQGVRISKVSGEETIVSAIKIDDNLI